MKKKTIKIILTLLIIAGVISLIKKYPDVTIVGLGIGSIIIIGLWLMEIEKPE